MTHHVFIARLIFLRVCVFALLNSLSFTAKGVETNSKKVILTVENWNANEQTLTVRIQNSESSPIRLWQRDNSWGWSNWSVSLFLADRVIIYARTPAGRFTRNFPEYDEIEPGKSKTIRFDLKDGKWITAEMPVPNAGKERCGVVYYNRLSPEAARFGVWTGLAAASNIAAER